MSYKLLSVEDLLQLKQDKLSEGQLASANSGITQLKVVANENHISNSGIHVTEEQKTAWSAKQDAIAAFLKDAVVDGGVLTITKKDGSTVIFQAESVTKQKVISTGLSASDIGAQPALESDGSDLPGGPYLQKSGGTIEGNVTISAPDGLSGGKRTLTVYGSGGNVVISGGIGQAKPSIKLGRVYAATEDQLSYASTSIPADRTCATVTVAATGTSVTIPKPNTENKISSFCVYLDMTSLTGTAPNIGFRYPVEDGETEAQDAILLTRDGSGLSYETGAINALFFVQCGSSYIASAQVYK